MRDDDEPVSYTVLSRKAIWWFAAGLVVVGIGAAVGLLLAFGRGDAQQRNQLDAVRTAGTIVVGSGGAAALLLAARRQRSTEIALKQKDRDQVDIARAYALQERVAEDARQDAVERRITELYTKAADQLGSDKAPVRLAGLYALERLAQDNESQRQTIVNVLCAYLRMPFDARLTAVPSSSGDVGAEGAPSGVPSREEIREHAQERQVRLTAQRILTGHIKPGDDPDHPAVTFWGDTDLDLTGATLIDFEMIDGHVRSARFGLARFAGGNQFDGARFAGDAQFGGARFSWDARFDGASFAGAAQFGGADFVGDARFRRASFARDAGFDRVKVAGDVGFDGATFAGDAKFSGAHFARKAYFGRASFGGKAWFTEASFAQDAVFSGDAWFGGDAWFSGGAGASFAGDAVFDGASFAGDAEFSGATFAGDARFGGDGVFGKAKFTKRTAFDGAWMRGVGSLPDGWARSTTPGVPWLDAEGEWRQLVRESGAHRPVPDGTAGEEHPDRT